MPWRRLLREFAIYAAIMAVVLLIITRGNDTVPLLIGLVAALPLYVGLGALMAKLGYQRKSLAELRTPRATSTGSAAPSPTGTERPRPAPTRRTSAGANRPNTNTRRKH